MHIARQYLEPQTRDDAGVPVDAAEITDVAMAHLINEYARYITLQDFEHPLLTVLLVCTEQGCCWESTESSPLSLLSVAMAAALARSFRWQSKSISAILQISLASCREAGVRNLKKHLEKIYRKVALKLVKQGAGMPAHAAEPASQDNPVSQEALHVSGAALSLLVPLMLKQTS